MTEEDEEFNRIEREAAMQKNKNQEEGKTEVKTNTIFWAVKLRGRSLLKGANGVPAMRSRQSDAEARAMQVARDRGVLAEAARIRVRIEETA